MIVFELSWLFTLAILWVATAGDAISTSNQYYPGGRVDYDPTMYCMELQAVELSHSTTSSYVSFTQFGSNFYLTIRGDSVWTHSVKEVFFAQESWPVQRQPQPFQQYQPVYSGQSQRISV
ncbi:hypothetical protein BDR07DRAFT_1478815 [Suillus spraguei]|nr:hypothetical protein BDR07DRAFT_1478815 [Suillus spraguei]